MICGVNGWVCGSGRLVVFSQRYGVCKGKTTLQSSRRHTKHDRHDVARHQTALPHKHLPRHLSFFFFLSSFLFPLSLCAVFTFTLASVQNYDDVEKLMNLGVAARTVAATNMNSTSSRAHTVFTVILTQQQKSPDTGKIMKKTSKINLVDLAGSERANATGATGDRLKEGCAINQSLSSLGNVINALAKQSEGGATGKKKKKKRKVVVPYRASKLYVLVHTTSTRCVWCF